MTNDPRSLILKRDPVGQNPEDYSVLEKRRRDRPHFHPQPPLKLVPLGLPLHSGCVGVLEFSQSFDRRAPSKSPPRTCIGLMPPKWKKGPTSVASGVS
jgi:hypothetical protein